jgi:hypothetical protein
LSTHSGSLSSFHSTSDSTSVSVTVSGALQALVLVFATSSKKNLLEYRAFDMYDVGGFFVLEDSDGTLLGLRQGG